MATEIDALGAWTPPEEEEGIDEKELWNLDVTLTDFILPRLKAFKKMERNASPPSPPAVRLVTDEDGNETYRPEWGHPKNEEALQAEWEKVLDKIIAAFEIHQQSTTTEGWEKRQEAMQKGFQLFAEHYTQLWD